MERQFIEWLGQQKFTTSGVPLGIGDDMAIVDGPSGCVLVSSDMMLDGVHFDSAKNSAAQIGRKAMACALSDCAAMAVRPIAATLSLALPPRNREADARAIVTAAAELANEFGAELVGGDTTCWSNPLAIDVSVTAMPYDAMEPIRRSGACVGDEIFVTGLLGGSRLGRHMTFRPRVDEAFRIATVWGTSLHAMIDVSDGLSLDLWRICEASGVGAVLDEQLLADVVSDDATRASEMNGQTPLQHALFDGEDFELLIAAAPDVIPDDLPVKPIGKIVASDLSIRRADQQLEPLEPKGYVHG